MPVWCRPRVISRRRLSRGGAVVQPVVVLGDAAVAQFAVAARQPGDGAFDHGPVLTVFGLPIPGLGVSPGGALHARRAVQA